MGEFSATQMYIIWIVAILVFSVVEAVTAQLVSIWFVIGAIAAFVASLFNVPILIQVIIFIAITIVALVITRPIVKKYINPRVQHTNADRVLNQTAVVIEEINNLNGTGQVKVDGKIWTARSTNNKIIPEESIVRIDKISGVKLLVSQTD
jgi:membrane protein implicated in regulation of membrane protease activity